MPILLRSLRTKSIPTSPLPQHLLSKKHKRSRARSSALLPKTSDRQHRAIAQCRCSCTFPQPSSPFPPHLQRCSSSPWHWALSSTRDVSNQIPHFCSNKFSPWHFYVSLWSLDRGL